MSRLIILTGPQGSGNKLFSKLFGICPAVSGWYTNLYLQKDFHHGYEPFYECWSNPTKLENYNWDSSNIHVANISCPYYGKVDDEWTNVVPDFVSFIKEARKYVIDIEVILVSRDENIIELQNFVWGNDRSYDLSTLTEQLAEIDVDINVVSHEAVYQYKDLYWNNVLESLNLPKSDPDLINEILTDNRNKKYVSQSKRSFYKKMKGDGWPEFNDINKGTVGNDIKEEILSCYREHYNVKTIEDIK